MRNGRVTPHYLGPSRRPGGLLAGCSIDGLTKKICVTVVAGVLLDHVRDDPPQACRLAIREALLAG